MRTVLQSQATYYVDHVNGNDANDGSQARPWKSVQWACNFLVRELDFARHEVTIQLVGTGYVESLFVATQPLGHHVFTLRGDPSNPQNCKWVPPVPGVIVSATDYGAVTLDGIEFGFSCPGGTCLAAFQFGIIDVRNCMFAHCEAGYHMKAENNGSINIIGPYAINGNAISHVFCDHASVNLGAQSVAMNGNPAIDYFVDVRNAGYVAVGGAPYAGIGAAAGTRGRQYNVSANGVLRLNGVKLPGDARGRVSTGGQVV